ncbi:MAG: MJ1477/TM1410 family putative glycoside hydrolase [Planctomycetota bacterium]
MKRGLLCLVAIATVCLPGAATSGRADLSWVQSWAIQLQGAEIDELVASTYDVTVIDYSRDGTDAGAYSYGEIERVRASGKLVFAYLSLGEASDFRFYWQDGWKEGNPSFIGPANPNWPGAYKARYWKRGWWTKVIRPYLDRILAAGFDGVWLDSVDAYWFWYLEGYDPVWAADRMARLVRKVSQYARDRYGTHFVVCPNNGLAMLDDASARWRDRYLADIDAVGVESLFYNYWSPEDQAYRLWKLEQYAAAGKKLFNVEYIALDLLDEYFATLAAQSIEILGYPAAPDRLLDELILY